MGSWSGVIVLYLLKVRNSFIVNFAIVVNF